MNDREPRVAPVYGLRAFRFTKALTGELRLASVYRNVLWVPGSPGEARCLSVFVSEEDNNGTRRSRYLESRTHEVPDEQCRCGFYGLYTLDHLEDEFSTRYANLCAGLVKAWGRVNEGEFGFRAQFVRLERLYPFTAENISFPAGLRYDLRLRRAASVYRVPLDGIIPQEVPA